MSSCRFEERLKGAVLSRVVGRPGLPAVPDHEQPGAGEDADRVRVVVAAGDGPTIEVGRPRVGADGVAGEVADGVAELLVGGPAEADRTEPAGLASAGRDAGEAGQGVGGREASAAVADLGQQAGGADPAGAGQAGEDVGVGVQRELLSICSERSLICWTTVLSAARKARVTWAWAAPSVLVAPRGAEVSRACRVAGATLPQ